MKTLTVLSAFLLFLSSCHKEMPVPDAGYDYSTYDPDDDPDQDPGDSSDPGDDGSNDGSDDGSDAGYGDDGSRIHVSPHSGTSTTGNTVVSYNHDR